MKILIGIIVGIIGLKYLVGYIELRRIRKIKHNAERRAILKSAGFSDYEISKHTGD